MLTGGNVEWRVVGLLAVGSVPATLATIYMMTQTQVRSPELTHMVTVAIGVALLLAAAGLLVESTSFPKDRQLNLQQQAFFEIGPMSLLGRAPRGREPSVREGLT
jgi:hypothetical protein